MKVSKEKLQKISFNIPKQIYEQLKRKAEMMDIPVSALYRHCLERGIEAEEEDKKAPPSVHKRLLRMQQQRMGTYQRLQSALRIAEMPDSMALKTLRVLRNGKLGFRISKEEFKEFVELVNYFRKQAGDQGFIVEEEKAKDDE